MEEELKVRSTGSRGKIIPFKLSSEMGNGGSSRGGFRVQRGVRASLPASNTDLPLCQTQIERRERERLEKERGGGKREKERDRETPQNCSSTL